MRIPALLALLACISPPSARAQPAGALGLEQLQDITQVDLEALLAAPVVESASRRAQSLHEAPAAVSVITAQQLQHMGVRNPAGRSRSRPS